MMLKAKYDDVGKSDFFKCLENSYCKYKTK